MRCFGEFTNDRLCDLCKLSDSDVYNDCRRIRAKKSVEHQRLQRIKQSCPHRTHCYDEYTPFDGCSRNGNGLGRRADECKETLECEVKL